jgi:multisubunit Na+/H+ antiporter MnhG subunit
MVAQNKTIKISAGTFFILLGIYLAFSNLQNAVSVIGGILVIAIGLGIISSA